jgi:hypothetical protein
LLLSRKPARGWLTAYPYTSSCSRPTPARVGGGPKRAADFDLVTSVDVTDARIINRSTSRS